MTKCGGSLSLNAMSMVLIGLDFWHELAWPGLAWLGLGRSSYERLLVASGRMEHLLGEDASVEV